MKGVILVGGEGTRMRPLTLNTPKAMLPVLNKPFLEHMIGNLKVHGIDDIVLSSCYLPDRIQDYFGQGHEFGVNLNYVVEESPLGTAGGVKNAERFLDDVFFVFNGDIFTDIDLSQMLLQHRERKAKASIALTPVDDPSRYGVVETDSQGMVKRFVEKPKREEATSNMINAGIYILEPEVMEHVPPETRFMFEHHLFPHLLDINTPIMAYPSNDYWIDMGTPDKYLQLHCDMLERRCLSSPYVGDFEFGTDCSMDSTASVEGPVIIGNRCIIGGGVNIKGPAVIGSDCKLDNNAVIEGAIIWQNVIVERGAVLKNCVVGSNCLIGAASHVSPGSVVADNTEIPAGSLLQS
jgi:mannose-1-phosphate guanylyltransferase